MAKKENTTTTPTPAAPSFGTVEPPRRRRKGGFEIGTEVVTALLQALDGARETQEWIGDGQVYATMGKAQAASQRYRRALLDENYIDDVKQIASRVWQDGDEYRFALRLRTPEDKQD